jgi:hypothetical protein
VLPGRCATPLRERNDGRVNNVHQAPGQLGDGNPAKTGLPGGPFTAPPCRGLERGFLSIHISIH